MKDCWFGVVLEDLESPGELTHQPFKIVSATEVHDANRDSYIGTPSSLTLGMDQSGLNGTTLL